MRVSIFNMTRPRLLVWAAVCVYVFDRVLKQAALGVGDGGGAPIADFHLFLNYGIAFSIQLPAAVYWLAMLAAAAALIWAFVAAIHGRRDTLPPLTFVALGALSNLLDRIVLGATVDYLIFFGRSAVNLADGMILGGLIWLVWLEYRRGKRTGASSSIRL